MTLIVRAFPIAPGREDEVHAMAEEVRTHRAAEAAEFYRRHGVSRESWHVQRTPHGTWVIGVTDITEQPVAAAAEQFARSEEPFDRWLKDHIHRLSGVNPDEQPLGPPSECVFDTAMFGAEAQARD